MENSYSDKVLMLLQDANDMLDRSIGSNVEIGNFFNVRAIGYALVAIGRILAEQRQPTPSLANTEVTARWLRKENNLLAAALENAYILQPCGHPRACIQHDDDGAEWCEACVSVAAAGERHA
jgi:hypothetical protein